MLIPNPITSSENSKLKTSDVLAFDGLVGVVVIVTVGARPSAIDMLVVPTP